MKVETSRLVFDLLLSDDAADMAARQARICLDLSSNRWERHLRDSRGLHLLRVQRACLGEAQRATRCPS